MKQIFLRFIQNGEFEKLLNKNINIKSLYPNSYDEYNKIKKLLISLRILLFKNNIYKKYIKNNYDVEVAFLEGPITNILSSKNKKTKKIAWIHTDLSSTHENSFKLKIKKIINKKIYKKYSDLVFVSKQNLNEFNKIYNIQNNKQVIHNYLNIENVLLKAKEFNADLPKDNIPNFVTVARLVEAKALDRLITVHYKLIKEGYNHRFFVVGNGPLKSKLEELIVKLNLKESFFLCGQKENPYPYILDADFFCLLSYTEGLPMTLLESKILNKYIIITDNSSKEALENYENKKIVENSEDGIYNGLKEIIKNYPNIKITDTTSNDENNEIINKIKNLLGDQYENIYFNIYI